MYIRIFHEPAKKIRDKLAGKKAKKSTLVESMSSWACSDMAHPVITMLEVSECGDLPRRRDNILT